MSLFVDIEKKLGSFRLRVRFEAHDGVMALLGASGSGKSMTLKCIAGIETPDRGRIELDGVTLFDSEKRINLPPQKRRVGYLFQQYALFPNMTVRQNVTAGLRKGRSERAVDEMIAAMGLAGLEDKRPHQLSGGQQQRTALARILVNEPELLLLDEPFSALDSHLRFRLEQEVRDVVRGFGKPVLLVSHDRDEVYRLSDRIAVIHDGRVETVVSREELFHAPGTRSAAILTGCKNISRLQPLSDRRVLAADWGMELTLDRDVGDAAYLGIQMHDITAADGPNTVECRVVEEIENPFSYTVLLCPADRPDAEPLGWKISKKLWSEHRGDTVRIALPPDKLLLLRE